MLGWNVCYVVCGLVIDEGKVLMVQEAKLSCREKWYLPAGRVEPNESLEVSNVHVLHGVYEWYYRMQ